MGVNSERNSIFTIYLRLNKESQYDCNIFRNQKKSITHSLSALPIKLSPSFIILALPKSPMHTRPSYYRKRLLGLRSPCTILLLCLQYNKGTILDSKLQ